MEIEIRKQVTYVDFTLGDVQPLPGGGVQIAIIERDGTAHAIPLSERAAHELGKKLLAPRVAIAAPNGSAG